MITRLLTLLGSVRVRNTCAVNVRVIIRVIRVLISRLHARIISFHLGIVNVIRISALTVIDGRGIRLNGQLVCRLRRLVSVLVLLNDRLLLILSLTLSNTNRIMTTIAGTLCLKGHARRQAGLYLNVVARVNVTRLVRVLNCLGLRIVQCTLVLLSTLVRLIRDLNVLYVRRLSRRAGRAVGTLTRAASFLLYLRSEGLQYLRSADLSGTRTRVLVLLVYLELSGLTSRLFRLQSGPSRRAYITSVRTNIRRHRSSERRLHLLHYQRATVEVMTRGETSRVRREVRRTRGPSSAGRVRRRVDRDHAADLNVNARDDGINDDDNSSVLARRRHGARVSEGRSHEARRSNGNRRHDEALCSTNGGHACRGRSSGNRVALHVRKARRISGYQVVLRVRDLTYATRRGRQRRRGNGARGRVSGVPTLLTVCRRGTRRRHERGRSNWVCVVARQRGPYHGDNASINARGRKGNLNRDRRAYVRGEGHRRNNYEKALGDANGGNAYGRSHGSINDRDSWGITRLKSYRLLRDLARRLRAVSRRYREARGLGGGRGVLAYVRGCLCL